MKTELLKIAQDLEQDKINDNEARTLLLGLLGVRLSLPDAENIVYLRGFIDGYGGQDGCRYTQFGIK